MGTLFEQVVVCITYAFDSNDLSELDRFVEEYPDLFAKSGELINSTVNYVMFWDGSKEGWDNSNEGDELRRAFLEACDKLCLAHVYQINNHELYEDHPKLLFHSVRNYDGSTSAKRGEESEN